MKIPSFPKILLFCLLISGLTQIGLAQAPPADTPAAQSAEPVTADDHFSFMESEQARDPHREPTTGGLMLKTLGAMLLIVGIIFFGAWGIRKLGFGGKRAGPAPENIELSMLDTLSLGSGRSISTVRFGSRVLLVGSTAQAFTLLAEEESYGPEPAQRSRSVAEMLADESVSFDEQFSEARERLGLWENSRAKI